MKKLFILLCFCQVGLAQENATPPHRFLGLGYKLGAFQTSELNGSFSPLNRLFLSVDPVKFLRADLQYGVMKSTNQQVVSDPFSGVKTTYDLENSNSMMQIGVFGTIHLDDMLLFIGLRYGFTNGKSEYLQSTWTGTTQVYTIESNKVKGSNVSPVLGAEYRFGNRFAVGAELSYLIMKQTNDPGSPNAQNTESKMNLIETAAFFRFFPF